MDESFSLVYDRLWFTNMMTMSNSGRKLWLFTLLSETGCWSVVVDVYLWIDNTKMNINSSVFIVGAMLLNVYIMMEFTSDKITI